MTSWPSLLTSPLYTTRITCDVKTNTNNFKNEITKNNKLNVKIN